MVFGPQEVIGQELPPDTRSFLHFLCADLPYRAILVQSEGLGRSTGQTENCPGGPRSFSVDAAEEVADHEMQAMYKGVLVVILSPSLRQCPHLLTAATVGRLRKGYGGALSR